MTLFLTKENGCAIFLNPCKNIVVIAEKQGRSTNIQDKSQKNKIFSADGQSIAQRYTTLRVMVTVLDCSQHPVADLQPVLREDVEIAVAALKKGKSTGVDNIQAGFVQAGGESMVDLLTKICNKIWKTGEWPTPWTQSLIITLPKKGNLQLCEK